MVEVRKRPDENIGSLLRRFAERLKKSGILQEAKEAQVRQPHKSRRLRREEAIRRERLARRREFLRKLGRL